MFSEIPEIANSTAPEETTTPESLILPSDETINGIVDIINKFREGMDIFGLPKDRGTQINPSATQKSVNSEQVVAIINRLRRDKDASKKYHSSVGKDSATKITDNGSQIPSEEEVSLFNEVCLSRMSESNDEIISDDEKVGQKDLIRRNYAEVMLVVVLKLKARIK